MQFSLCVMIIPNEHTAYLCCEQDYSVMCNMVMNSYANQQKVMFTVLPIVHVLC